MSTSPRKWTLCWCPLPDAWVSPQDVKADEDDADRGGFSVETLMRQPGGLIGAQVWTSTGDGGVVVDVYEGDEKVRCMSQTTRFGKPSVKETMIEWRQVDPRLSVPSSTRAAHTLAQHLAKVVAAGKRGQVSGYEHRLLGFATRLASV